MTKDDGSRDVVTKSDKEERDRQDAFYLALLNECKDKEKRLLHLQGLKIGEAPWVFDDAMKLSYEIETLKSIRFSYIEHLIRTHSL